MRCPHCGPLAQQRSEGQYCPRCGAQLLGSDITSPAAAIGESDYERPARTSIGVREPAVGSVADILGCPRRQIIAIDQAAAAGSDYQLLEVIGSGGMGVIYAAQQTAVHRQVALKRLLNRRHGNAGEEAGFLIEALITAKLDHPNIIPIHDIGVDQEGVLFYTMRKVEGRPWSETIATRTVDENLDILLHVSDAIAYAHSRDLIHRDLKPENILLGNFGEVLVTDWGLAIEIEALRSGIATVRMSCGTPAYMAPEMAWDDRRAIGKRSDIYLLGAILHEILTGFPPHPGASVRASIEAAGANIIEPPSPGSELGAIARRALATMPEDRFGEVREFHQAIVACRTHVQSELLVDSAEKLAEEASRQEQYQGMSRALHSFEEALVLWPGNQRAATGLVSVRRSYAGMALAAGDLDLAESLAPGDHPDDRTLRARAASARERRKLHASRVQLLAWSSAGLLALLFAVLAGALVISIHEREKVVLVTRDRDRAEAHLAPEAGLRQQQDRRMWEPVMREDFNAGVLPPEIKEVSGAWSIAHGQLLASGPGESRLRLTVDASGDLRIRLDRVNLLALRVYLGVSSSAVADQLDAADVPSVLVDRHCRIYRGTRELGVIDMPEGIAGLSQRITIERDGGMVHVQVDGHPLLGASLGDWKNPADARLVITAEQGFTLEDLRVESLRVRTAAAGDDHAAGTTN
jgi:hypothetical protein